MISISASSSSSVNTSSISGTSERAAGGVKLCSEIARADSHCERFASSVFSGISGEE